MQNHEYVAISGGTAGIGLAVAQSVLASGGRICISGRRGDRIRDFCGAYSNPAPRACGVISDASDADHVQRLFEESKRTLGALPTAFVLCAGRGLPGSLTTSDESQWQDLLRVNVLGAMRQLRACAQVFSAENALASRVRDIVVIGSTAGRTLSAANPVYGATKFALHSLVESLRQELCQYGIRVTLVEPGFVKTEFQASAGYDMEWFSELEREQGPFLTAPDVADVIRFVLEQPSHVHLDDVRIRPTHQRV